ncbi:MAG TPA: MFS transporter [Ktedonobacterales bacterium]
MDTTTETSAAPAQKPNWLINRNFALLWVGDVISALGDYSFSITLTIWVGVVLAKGQPWAPLAITGLVLTSSIPMMVVGPIAGVYVDRWDKRKTMMVVDLLQALLVGILVVTTFFPGGSLPLGWELGTIYAVSFLLVATDQFFNQAGNTLIRDIVPQADLPRAIGRVLTMVSIGTIIGPSIGAPLFVAFGARWALLINTISFLVSFALILAIRPPHHEAASSASGEKKRFFPEFSFGLRFLFSSRILRAMLIATVVYTIGTSAVSSLNIFFITGNLHTPDALYGFVAAALGIGSLIGAMIGSTFVKRLGLERVFWGSLLAIGICTLIYARLSFFALALVILFLIGVPSGTLNVAAGPLYFRVTPRDVLARTTAVRVSVAALAGLVGTTLAGYLDSTILINLHVNAFGVVFSSVDTIILAGGVLVVIGGLYAMRNVHGAPSLSETQAAQAPKKEPAPEVESAPEIEPASEAEPAPAAVQVADSPPSEESV